jgi:hypothetical protein
MFIFCLGRLEERLQGEKPSVYNRACHRVPPAGGCAVHIEHLVRLVNYCLPGHDSERLGVRRDRPCWHRWFDQIYTY